MFRNYFKTAWRSLWKNRIFSSINIAGLAIGMAACLLILQYVSFEFSYDHFNKNADNLYRVVNDHYQDGKLTQHSTMTYSGIGRVISEEHPEVAAYSRVEPYRVEIISNGDKKIADQRAIAVDNSFLTMFSYPLLHGDINTALKETNSVVISEKLASQLFNADRSNVGSIIGKALVFDRDSVPYKITGVSKDVPANSHLQFDLLMSYVSLYSSAGNNRWGIADHDFTQPSFWHYIQLKPGVDRKALEAKLANSLARFFPKHKAAGAEEQFSLQPLTQAHLYSDFEYDIVSNSGNHRTVASLLIIAILILVIAWVNYINLTTAKAAERAKEVGIRKVVGAARGQLIRQFLAEAVIVNMIALAIAFGLMTVCQQSFNMLVDQQLSFADFLHKGPVTSIIITGLALAIPMGIFLSGFYPAIILSSYKPIKVLKGKFIHSAKGVLLRKWLVTGQFAITILLVIGSMVIYRQLKFMNSQPLGYNIEQMLVLRKPVLADPDTLFMERAANFIAELGRLTHVKGAAASGRIPGDELGKERNVHRTDIATENKITLNNMGIDSQFLSLYNIKLLSGRNFSPADYNRDRSKLRSVILNETAIQRLNFASPEEAIGKGIAFFGREWTIIGVVNDFHQRSLRYAMEPTALIPSLQGRYSLFSVKVDTKDLPSTVEEIKKSYVSFFPRNLFDYYFLDERFNKQYAGDLRFGKVFALFAGLGIFIACLGLLGLSYLSTTQRIKEIGVRKILGASVSTIVVLIAKDFVKLVLLSFFIATPVAWLVMRNWLEDFAYRITIGPWIFIAAGLLALVVSLFTISFQAIRAAIANPVKSLRTE